jgi:pyruvate-ferredoxin/flavodoxin oxidoreductase
METGLGSRINTILQTCFFAISSQSLGIPKEEAIEKIKQAIAKTYSKKGEAVIQKNFTAVNQAVENLIKVNYPKQVTSKIKFGFTIDETAPEFVKNTLQRIISGEGEELPVSAFPADGIYPTATTRWEKRNIATLIPV